jgi:hypothetical protein
MSGIETWGDAITMSMINLGQRVISFLPALLGAIFVFIAGWIVAVVLGRLVEKALKTVRLDRAMERMGLGARINNIGVHYTISEFIGGLVKWFLILVFLMASVDILGLDQVTSFLGSILLYIPNVVVAVIILAVVFLVGNFVYNIVKGSTRAAGVVSATMLATISKWSIIIFGIFAALIQLGIASSLVSTIFIGIITMLSLAGGLAFGLGGRDEAALILKKIRQELTENRK